MTKRTEAIEVIMTDQRRRRWSLEEKATLVRRTYEPGMTVSLVAREAGVSRPACCSSGENWNVKAP